MPKNDMNKGKKIKLNKKATLIAIIIIVAIIITVTVVVCIKTFKKEEDKTPEINNEIEVGDFVSEIDMTDTSNSEIREDGMKINNSSKIAKGIEFNDVLVKNIQIESTGDMATFNAEVDNNLGKDIEGYIIYLTFLDKSGNTIDKVETFFPDIPDGETGYITATTPKDIATAYDIKIEREIK